MQPALSNLVETLEMEEEDTGQRSPLITFSHFLPLQVLLSPFLLHRCHAGSCKHLAGTLGEQGDAQRHRETRSDMRYDGFFAEQHRCCQP